MDGSMSQWDVYQHELYDLGHWLTLTASKLDFDFTLINDIIEPPAPQGRYTVKVMDFDKLANFIVLRNDSTHPIFTPPNLYLILNRAITLRQEAHAFYYRYAHQSSLIDPSALLKTLEKVRKLLGSIRPLDDNRINDYTFNEDTESLQLRDDTSTGEALVALFCLCQTMNTIERDCIKARSDHVNLTISESTIAILYNSAILRVMSMEDEFRKRFPSRSPWQLVQSLFSNQNSHEKVTASLPDEKPPKLFYTHHYLQATEILKKVIHRLDASLGKATNINTGNKDLDFIYQLAYGAKFARHKKYPIDAVTSIFLPTLGKSTNANTPKLWMAFAIHILLYYRSVHTKSSDALIISGSRCAAILDEEILHIEKHGKRLSFAGFLKNLRRHLIIPGKCDMSVRKKKTRARDCV